MTSNVTKCLNYNIFLKINKEKNCIKMCLRGFYIMFYSMINNTKRWINNKVTGIWGTWFRILHLPLATCVTL